MLELENATDQLGPQVSAAVTTGAENAHIVDHDVSRIQRGDIIRKTIEDNAHAQAISKGNAGNLCSAGNPVLEMVPSELVVAVSVQVSRGTPCFHCTVVGPAPPTPAGE